MPSNVKSKRALNFLQWLENNKGVRLIEGSSHLNVKHIYSGKKFPLTSRHSEIHWKLFRKFEKWLMVNSICSKDEIKKNL